MKSIAQRAIDCRNEDWVGVGKQCNGVLMGIPVWENNMFLASKKCTKWQLKMPLAKFRYWLREIESL
ncbi:hypothetical protein [Anoxybacteroides rupiense]|uniref:hypothetical protein n=1 Tax=Anoxybacteroides rupiense TaxID=311460 RepID=UPI0016068660|nr:hypothetical protein [Anoxybacillus rupiensis]MBB3908788.1 hypothetical protein [Anoxybacillus rupiensis]